MSHEPEYAGRLKALQASRWKRVLDVQAPYRWSLKCLRPGRTLDVGCGIGRNLANLGGEAVGVDPNPACIAEARARGFEAYLPEELPPGQFETILIAHVLEHLDEPAKIVANYLPRLQAGGRVIMITPQESGFYSDATHVRFLDFCLLEQLSADLGLKVERAYSFPFPRKVGRFFRYNEFVVIARKAL